MQNSTPSNLHPKETTLKRLKAFARAYRPQLQATTEIPTTNYKGKVVMLLPL